ncbi:hypothetical protein [Dactylosporangium sp. CS-033363]|uniref:hypothetical protein n=1 Tax=Dactylosporangium sp. CS-033363 TaxID=3239935 RepID=UPI003D9256FC
MVAARTAAKGLSTVDLEQIRDTLAAGRKPKVVFTEQAGQIAGQLGQIVALTDPELSDEWVVVRFGRDELPFSPADLAIAPKTAPAKRAPAVPAPREESPVPAPSVADSPAATAAPDSSPAAAGDSSTDSKAAGSPAKATAAPAGDTSASSGPAAPGSSTDAGGDSSDSSASAAKNTPGKPAAKKAAPKPKPAPGLTVTLAYAEGEWTVAANQGAKALAKPYVIKAGEALKMVAMLDVPGVHEAVEEIVSAARAEAEGQAERLRAELAEIEARLAELREAE